MISDTHRSIKLAESAIKDHLPADLLIHLGDFVEDGRELADLLGLEFKGVRGNNDLREGPNELEFHLNGFKIIALHGHSQELDSGLDRLFQTAVSRDARLVLFGHNHRPGIYRRKQTWLMNPGNLFFAESEQSLGVIQEEDTRIVLSIFNLKQGAFTDVREIPTGPG